MVADPLSWRLLRVQQKLSRAEAAASIARSVIALARDAQRSVSRPLKSSAAARTPAR